MDYSNLGKSTNIYLQCFLQLTLQVLSKSLSLSLSHIKVVLTLQVSCLLRHLLAPTPSTSSFPDDFKAHFQTMFVAVN